jgi:ribosomal protein L22
MIKNKTPENAVKILEKVLIKKIAVPMNKLEVPHRRGDIMAGRYPINAVKEFIKLLKQLKANANVNNIEEPVIALAFANRASRPYRRGGKRAKRTNVYIEVKSRIKQK